MFLSPTLEIRNCCEFVVACDADLDVEQAPVKSSIKIMSNLYISLFTIAVPFWGDMKVGQITMNRITILSREVDQMADFSCLLS